MKICKLKGCKKVLKASGYCAKHYAQISRYGKILKRTKFDKNKVVNRGYYSEIVLYNSKNCEVARTIVDNKYLTKIKKYKFYFGGSGYAMYRDKNKNKYLHHLILNKKKGYEIDHINRNKLDNRRNNLRIVTYSQNKLNINLQKNNKSGITGVYWCPSIKYWRASIGHNNKQHCFVSKNLDEAIKKRKEFENKYIIKH